MEDTAYSVIPSTSERTFLLTEPKHAFDEELAAAVEATRQKPKTWLPSEVYDLFKWATLIALPAASTLYAGLSAVWGWGFSGEVATSITVVCTFLGVILGLSKADYDAKDGGTNGTVKLGGADAQLTLDQPADPGDKVTLKVL